jgi:hypothetical protein
MWRDEHTRRDRASLRQRLDKGASDTPSSGGHHPDRSGRKGGVGRTGRRAAAPSHEPGPSGHATGCWVAAVRGRWRRAWTSIAIRRHGAPRAAVAP